MLTIDKTTTVAFTGHRWERMLQGRPDLDADTFRECVWFDVYEHLQDLYYKQGYRTFISGMAQGFDLLAAKAVLGLREEHDGVRLIAAVSFPGQAKGYSVTEEELYKKILAEADERITLAEHNYKGCYFARNRYMVDNCSQLLAYWDHKQEGGTSYTVDYARKHSVPVINLYITPQP